MVNIYRSRVSLTGGIAGAGVSTMYWAASAPPGAAAISAAVGGFWDAIVGNMVNDISATLSPELEEVDPATGRLVDVHAMTGWTKTGFDTGEPMPWATQGLIRWRTGVTTGTPAKEIRGRTYIPGVPVAKSTGGRPSTAYQTTLTAAVTAAVTTPTTVDLLIYSPKTAAAYVVTSGSGWGEFAVLRSRRD